MVNLYLDTVIKSIFFRGSDNKLLPGLITSFFKITRFRYYNINDYICVVGEFCDEIYILLDGEATYIGFEHCLRGDVKRGECFGGVLPEERMCYSVKAR